MKNFLTASLVLVNSMSLAQMPAAGLQEPPNPKPPDTASWRMLNKQALISFASADVRYAKETVPSIPILKTWKTKGWKGEKVHTQLLIASTRDLRRVSFELSDLTDARGHIIARENVRVNFVRYVLTDSLGRKGGGCGIETDLDSSLVEDMLDNANYLDVAGFTTQPAWLSVAIPGSIPAGKYKGTLSVSAEDATATLLSYEVEVINRVLPPPRDWKFHLDLWQNPYAVSRQHTVPDWSPEHFAALKPYMEMLAAAGQKVITTSIIYDPWNSQTHDIYQSMVKWTKKKDASWTFDYTVFDAWVSFMMSLGIDKEINCYSMIPWNLKFYYYDEASGNDTLLIANPGTPAYEQHWRTMLSDFARHLKVKGWFKKTTIAMDERPMEQMQIALTIIKSADRDFKVSMAGEYHPEIEAGLSDYCVASSFILPREILERRKKAGFVTTYYTACPEPYPNTFTFSPPAESAFLGWYARAKGFDGYLRWASNSWPANPLQDSRFRSWSAGDTYFIYPGPRSSIRFERLIEGIQAYEKTRILEAEFKKNGQPGKLEQIKKLLHSMDIANIKTNGAARLVNNATYILNGL